MRGPKVYVFIAALLQCINQREIFIDSDSGTKHILYFPDLEKCTGTTVENTYKHVIGTQCKGSAAGRTKAMGKIKMCINANRDLLELLHAE